MDTRIAVVSIIVEDMESSVPTNELLHEFSQYIVGRMGIQYRQIGSELKNAMLMTGCRDLSSISEKHVRKA